MPLPDCLCHVSFRRYSPLTVEVVEKPNKCKLFWPPILNGETTRTFLRLIVTAIYCTLFGKVWLSSVCWPSCAKSGNKVECRIYRGWVKAQVQFEAVYRPKFMSFTGHVADPFWLSTHLPDCLYCVSFGIYTPLNLPLSCEIVQKGGFRPPICRGEEIPHILDIRFQIALTSQHVAGYGWVPFSELGD